MGTSGKYKNKNGNTTTIKLGRYKDFTMNGTTPPIPVQEATASSYNTAVIIKDYYFEVSDSFEGDADQDLKVASFYGNTKATNLQEWISTSLSNGGYYIARYEASQNSADNTKAASVKGVNTWVMIPQPNAAIAAKKTYPTDEENSHYYYSDLINSYAWDTAIVFIQAYSEHTDYANENLSTSETTETNGNLTTNETTTETTTGTDLDKVCNIHDMSGNNSEWTTESSSEFFGIFAYPCVNRGGYNGYNGKMTSYRNDNTVDAPVGDMNSFRLTLCVK